MTVLIFVEEIIDNASGIVIKRLLLEMSRTNHLIIYCFGCSYKELIDEHNIEIHIIRKPKILKQYHWLITNLSLALFTTDIFDEYLKRRILKKHKVDIIFSISYGVYLWSIVAGKYAKRLYQVKWMTYFIDPLPPHVNLAKNHPFPYFCSKFLDKYTTGLDAIAGSNQKMAMFQKQFISNINCYMDYLYTSFESSSLNYLDYDTQESYFLYTGSLKERNVTHLLNAFAKFKTSFPSNIKLVFVGSEKQYLPIFNCTIDIQSQIILFPRTNNLIPYYKKAVLLIDIDPDIKDNVYLSSKITNYIFVNRPILCLTGHDSPSRMILGKCKSIIFSQNFENEIYQSLISFLKYDSCWKYEDRMDILHHFSSSSVSNKLLSLFSKLASK